MFKRFLAWTQKYERHLSAAAMLAGFVGDNLFFQRVDLWQVQAAFIAYLLIAFVSILALHVVEARATKGHARPRWRALLPIATQFALGGFWSPALILYGRSAAFTASWPFLLLLAALFIGNEYFKKYHGRLVFSCILFFFALYTYAIFALPIATHTLGVWTFIGSGLIALLVFALFTWLLRRLGKERFLADIWRIRAGALAVLVLMNIFYLAHVLPPLPLAVEAAGVYHEVERVPGAYVVSSEREPWTVRYLGLPSVLHVAPGDSVSAYAAVFAPTALTTTIVHRWQHYDPATDAWVTKAAISYPIEGGGDGGYRGYTTIVPQEPGQWRVSIETADGLPLRRIAFTVVRVAAPVPTTQAVLKK